MKICALSDLHGTLPKIGQCDVVFICGDTFPLDIQRSSENSQKWLLNEFCEWVMSIPCKTVYFIGGNHDFWLERAGYNKVSRLLEEVNGLHGKLVYVKDSLIEIENGYTLYGCPWCTSPSGWAFIDESGSKYESIPECDILLTHQPPDVGKLGCSYPGTAWERNFGSPKLRDVIVEKKIKYNFCGHIHTGTHGGIKLPGGLMFYNVSIKDEDYEPTFEPTYLEI